MERQWEGGSMESWTSREWRKVTRRWSLAERGIAKAVNQASGDQVGDLEGEKRWKQVFDAQELQAVSDFANVLDSISRDVLGKIVESFTRQPRPIHNRKYRVYRRR